MDAGNLEPTLFVPDPTPAASQTVAESPRPVESRFSFSLLQSLHDTPIAVVDVETTGASAEWGDRVIELGIVRIEGGRTVAEYQQLLDPGRRVSPGVTALTGISQAMVDGQPRFVDQLSRIRD